MSWTHYYHLLEKYNGDLLKATKEELKDAHNSNPNTPPEARALAEKKWKNRKQKMELDFTLWLMKNEEELTEDYRIYIKKFLKKHKTFIIETWQKWTVDKFLEKLVEEKEKNKK